MVTHLEAISLQVWLTNQQQPYYQSLKWTHLPCLQRPELTHYVLSSKTRSTR